MEIGNLLFLRIFLQFTLIVATVFLTLPSAYAICSNDFDKNIQKILDEGREKYELVGMQLSILCKNEVIPHDFSTGTTTKDSLINISPGSLFQVGSITKSFTAALILKLEAEGLLSINDEIGMWLPQLPDAWKKITIRQLLNHTSGLYDYISTDLFSVFIADVNHQFQPDELLKFVKTTLLFPSGTGYFYSNTNYLLAGMIINAALASQNKSYASEIEEQIFNPLGLFNTYYLPHPYNKLIFSRMAHGYYLIYFPKVSDITSFNMSYTSTAGANVSTAHDVAMWLNNLVHGLVLPTKQQTEMLTMVDMETGKAVTDYGYGLGLYQHNMQNEKAWMHRGITMGYFNGMYYLICRDMTIAYTSTPSFKKQLPEDSEKIIEEIISYIQQTDPKEECHVSDYDSLKPQHHQISYAQLPY